MSRSTARFILCESLRLISCVKLVRVFSLWFNAPFLNKLLKIRRERIRGGMMLFIRWESSGFVALFTVKRRKDLRDLCKYWQRRAEWEAEWRAPLDAEGDRRLLGGNYRTNDGFTACWCFTSHMRRTEAVFVVWDFYTQFLQSWFVVVFKGEPRAACCSRSLAPSRTSRPAWIYRRSSSFSKVTATWRRYSVFRDLITLSLPNPGRSSLDLQKKPYYKVDLPEVGSQIG